MDLSSSDLELTTDGSELQLVGLRFQKVKIPKGSKILDARVQFTVDEVHTSGQVDVLIALEEEDNSAAISSNSNDLTSRSFTNNFVMWESLPGWSNVGDAGENQQTPDLSTLLPGDCRSKNWRLVIRF